MKKHAAILLEHLIFLYGKMDAPKIYIRLIALLDQFKQDHPYMVILENKQRINEKDVILIIYADMVKNEGEKPLRTLGKILRKYLVDLISTIHILPLYPFSSDDGFSVIDYRQVNSEFGSWREISQINQDFHLMFDAVIDHCSTKRIISYKVV